MVDRIIDLNFPLTLLKFRGLPHNKPIPPDWTFDTHGLRSTFFVGGQAVNKNILSQWWRMENDERRNKLVHRDWQGTHARHEDNTETTAQSLG